MIRDVFAAAAAITTRRRRRRRSGIEHFDRWVGRARRHALAVVVELDVVDEVLVGGGDLLHGARNFRRDARRGERDDAQKVGREASS